MPTVMEEALKAAGVPLKSLRERVWNWLKDHPEHSAEQLTALFNADKGQMASALSDLALRSMVVRTQILRPPGRRGPYKIWVYAVEPKMRGVYELLPAQKRLTARRVSKGITVGTLAPPPLAEVPKEPAKEASPELDDDHWVDQTVESMSLLRGQLLYQRLKTIFQA